MRFTFALLLVACVYSSINLSWDDVIECESYVPLKYSDSTVVDLDNRCAQIQECEQYFELRKKLFIEYLEDQRGMDDVSDEDLKTMKTCYKQCSKDNEEDKQVSSLALELLGCSQEIMKFSLVVLAIVGIVLL